MRHSGTIGGVQISSDRDFVVYGPGGGLTAECSYLAEAKSALLEKLAESNQCNVLSDLAIYRWSDEKWVPAVTPYEIQEWEIKRNPSRVIRFP